MDTELMFVDKELRDAVMPLLMEACAEKERNTAYNQVNPYTNAGRFNENCETLGKTRAEEALIFYDIMKTCEFLFDTGALDAIEASWITIDDPSDNRKRMPSLQPRMIFGKGDFYKTGDAGDIIHKIGHIKKMFWKLESSSLSLAPYFYLAGCWTQKNLHKNLVRYSDEFRIVDSFMTKTYLEKNIDKEKENAPKGGRKM